MSPLTFSYAILKNQPYRNAVNLYPASGKDEKKLIK